jgi:hypothetical protein
VLLMTSTWCWSSASHLILALCPHLFCISNTHTHMYAGLQCWREWRSTWCWSSAVPQAVASPPKCPSLFWSRQWQRAEVEQPTSWSPSPAGSQPWV